jgi:hypothetical protein
MAAGGFKTFTTGEVLTSADTNNFLMQGVLVFDDAAARDAAITAPVEGQVVYLKDTNAVLSYDGTSYVGVGGSSPLTTKGDLYTFSTVDARLGVGANDTVLTADSAEATGLKWAASAGYNPNYALINAGGTALTGAATITISGISGKKDLFIIIDSGSSANASAEFRIRFNADSAANYFQRLGVAYAASTASQDDITVDSGSTTSLVVSRMSGNASSIVRGVIKVSGCDSAGLKVVDSQTASNAAGANFAAMLVMGGYWSGSASVSSVSIVSSSGNFDAGTIYVYGA